MPDIQFIKADKKDIEVLVNFRVEFSVELSGQQAPELIENLRNTANKYLLEELNKNYFSWYVTVDGEPVAVAGLIKRKQLPNFKVPIGIWGYFIGVYTKPTFRRQGLSQKLMQLLEQTGIEHSIHAFELHATKLGEKVYPNCGFEIFEEPTFRKYVF